MTQADSPRRLDQLAEALGFRVPAQHIVSSMQALYVDVQAELDAHPFHEAPCHAGCSACCYESVFLSAPEFLLVADELLRTRTASELQELVAEMSRIADRFEDEFEQLTLIADGTERDDVAERIKFPCPLLSPAGLCTVYASRELNGRTFGLTRDSKRDEPYGCLLTREALRVLPDDRQRGLMDARVARQMLVDRLPNTELVHVYPYWFQHYGALLL